MRDEKLKTFPDYRRLIEYMDRARASGQEDLRAQYNPMYERSHGFSEGWGTHAPLLAAVVASARPGPVLELGVGRSSSPILVEMCRAMGRDLVGLESEKGWISELADLDYPDVHYMPDWGKLPAWLEGRGRWSVIFVDHGPGEARLPVLQMIRGYAEFIVCHDTHNEGYLPGFEAELDSYKYRHDYTLMMPCTTVVSDVRPYAGAK
jgi:hypothetical protein